VTDAGATGRSGGCGTGGSVGPGITDVVDGGIAVGVGGGDCVAHAVSASESENTIARRFIGARVARGFLGVSLHAVIPARAWLSADEGLTIHGEMSSSSTSQPLPPCGGSLSLLAQRK
jgi:hypothetical protein